MSDNAARAAKLLESLRLGSDWHTDRDRERLIELALDEAEDRGEDLPACQECGGHLMCGDCDA